MDKKIDYSNEIFIVISDDDMGKTIDKFCVDIYEATVRDDENDDAKAKKITTIKAEHSSDMNIAQKYTSELKILLNEFPKPYTIVQEFYYIDSSFRDTYYSYYSNQHFNIKRFSRRISLFSGIITEKNFFKKGNTAFLQQRLMGTCVINPLLTGLIGRTLIAPRYLLSKYQGDAYMRCSKYHLHIYGKKLYLEAFPYRMQDGETMRCAEITILNLIDYYANSYNDYRSVVPTEIHHSEKKYNHERVLPSKGVTYPILTKILTDFGFSPRLYNLSSISQYCLSRISPQTQLKRCLHYYIESGIPVALNLFSTGGCDAGHSVICVGHGELDDVCRKNAEKNKLIAWDSKDKCHPIIDSADFYSDYIIVDDNQPVYQIRKFPYLSMYPDMLVENIAAPLYKRMFLDATDAASIVKTILNDDIFGIDRWAKGFLNPNEDIIIRLFMASSRNLKAYRVESFTRSKIRKLYALTPMPRFVWVCELYRNCDYDNLLAFGELIIDATSVPGRGTSARGLILMHYPGEIGIRYPEQMDATFDDMVDVINDTRFPGYRKNLLKIEK